eukprot:1139293-Pelagomonas_calceolata.AAC.3
MSRTEAVTGLDLIDTLAWTCTKAWSRLSKQTTAHSSSPTRSTSGGTCNASHAPFDETMKDPLAHHQHA